MYYIKKLTPQELGYRNGSLKTGGYFYIAKSAARNFFGLLSKQKVNDHRTIKIFTLADSEDFAEATYVFHNDKHILEKGTRDEYRIYLNRKIQFHDMHFRPNDIVVFSTIPNRFILNHYKVSDDKYRFWNNLLGEFSVRGNHAIIDEI
jgi:hypothetical protein